MPDFVPVYLLQKGNPEYWARAFFSSYIAHDPGPKCALLLTLKGFPTGHVPDVVKHLPRWFQMRLIMEWLPDEGGALTTYRALCGLYPEGRFLFFASDARLLSPRWTDAFMAGLDAVGDDGLVGASGSFAADLTLSTSFPNPHIRANGFLISATTYLNVSESRVQDELACELFETGAHSLTESVRERGHKVVLVNSLSRVFQPIDWPSSGTYRLNDQDYLLVADTASDRYHFGSRRQRMIFGHETWGCYAKPATVRPQVALGRYVSARLLGHGHRFSSGPLRLSEPVARVPSASKAVSREDVDDKR